MYHNIRTDLGQVTGRIRTIERSAKKGELNKFYWRVCTYGRPVVVMSVAVPKTWK